MRDDVESSRSALSLLWLRLYSVPLYVKILGIGVLVTLLFGVVTYVGIRTSLYNTHYHIHAQTILAIARSLSSRIEDQIRIGDLDAVDREVDLVLQNFADVRYVIVQSPDNQILSHRFTFPMDIPADLMDRQEELCASCHAMTYPEELRAETLEIPTSLGIPNAKLFAYTRAGGLILEIIAPIMDGRAGSVRVGVSDTIVTQEVGSVTRALLVSLSLCLLIGQGLAVILTYVLVHPIRNLVAATNRLRGGDFETRARVYANDEIGELARTFNLMAEDLQIYRRHVQEKEAARVSLLERIVHVQEEERKSVARELHDQLGQSLSSVLLRLQQIARESGFSGAKVSDLEEEIRRLINDVRRLAWDIRPSILDDYGLTSALQRYVQETASRAELEIDYQCVWPHAAPRLPVAIEVTLYRIAQEAITNMVRHAAATHGSVVLLRREQDVTLLVEDDGRGFDVGSVVGEKQRSLGLLGMQERMALIGGSMAIESEPGKGTSIRIRIDLGELH
jgi:signal transduction histidine kinase